jgi:3-oxoacyl-[acyl-carrier-protein] synthase-3
MTTFSLPAPRLAGLAIALPTLHEDNRDLGQTFGAEAMERVIKATGIVSRPLATGKTISALAEAAAKPLLDQLGWERGSVDGIVVVTQTPDYPLPATSCLLQNRLGLPLSTMAFDLSLGCSGYVYGLSVMSSLLASGAMKRALLVTGDITTPSVPPDDRALRPLFGDAVAVTALEAGGDGSIAFDCGTDGSGAPYLMSASGGTVEPGAPRLTMDGTQVMAFSLKRVAPSLHAALAAAGASMDEIDALLLHQANAMMLKTLAQKAGARPDQVVNALEHCGNTSSASIGIALAAYLEVNDKPASSLLMSGFGVGWSWASAYWRIKCPSVVLRVAV